MLQRRLAGWPQKVEDQVAAVQVIHGVAKKQTNKQIATNNHLHQINFSTSVVHQQLAGGMELYCPQTLLTRPTNYLLHF